MKHWQVSENTTENPMTTLPVLPPPRPSPALPDFVRNDASLRDAAVKLEATFLAEMMRSAGLARPSENFGGGVGEDQYSGLLVDAQAAALVSAGGLGLAQSIYESLVRIEEQHVGRPKD